MKPYGSKRSFDTEPRIKVARALEKRKGEELAEEQLKSEADQADSEALRALEGCTCSSAKPAWVDACEYCKGYPTPTPQSSTGEEI